MDPQAQDGAIDEREPFQAPVVRVRRNQRVEVRSVFHNALEEIIGKSASGFLRASNAPEAILTAARLLPAYFPLKKHLNRVLPSLVPLRHLSGAFSCARQK